MTEVNNPIGLRTADSDRLVFSNATSMNDISHGVVIADPAQIIVVGKPDCVTEAFKRLGNAEWGRIGPVDRTDRSSAQDKMPESEPLSREDATFRAQKRHIPKLGETWPTQQRVGIVIAANITERSIVVEFDDGDPPPTITLD